MEKPKEDMSQNELMNLLNTISGNKKRRKLMRFMKKKYGMRFRWIDRYPNLDTIVYIISLISVLSSLVLHATNLLPQK